MNYSPEQTSGFSYAMAIAMAVHCFLILGITFTAVQATAPNSQMEVTLSQSSSNSRPDDADYIAQTSQQGSGTLEEEALLTNTTVAPFEDTSINTVDPLFLPEDPASAVNADSRVITTVGESPYSVPTDNATNTETEAQEENDYRNKNLAELSKEIASLEARLAEHQQRYAKKPRVLILTSASTIAASNAQYIHQWRDRIENVGNLHYPEEARRNKLYGDVRLKVSINANGIVEEIQTLESSGEPVLDKAAVESIWLASPFEPFTPELAAEYDRIEIIRTWQFRKNRLVSKTE